MCVYSILFHSINPPQCIVTTLRVKYFFQDDQELRDLKINLIFDLVEVHWAKNFSLSGKNNFLKESTFSLQK